MFVNIWSTPRTGSNWYTSYLFNQYQKSIFYHNNTQVLNQFLNFYNLKSYIIENYGDWIYEYQADSCYRHYYINKNGFIGSNFIYEKRKLSLEDEESYRIGLLESQELKCKCVILHNHVSTINQSSYNYLFKKADKNIFLYRENVLEQLCSYAIGFYTKNFHTPNNNIFDVDVKEEVLKNLADRIIMWHQLDKTNSEIIKYENLPFDNKNAKNLPVKQNNFNKFERLTSSTQAIIIKLNEYVLNSI